jgi:hypothetical protein
MKQINYKLMLAAIITGGAFIGIVKGQDAKTRWMNKMRGRQETRKENLNKASDEVMLDDYEIASYHKN